MAAARQPRSPGRKRYYTLEEANATLPLLRSILRDVTRLACELRDRHQRLTALQEAGASSTAHEEEVQGILEEFERGQEQMRAFEEELGKLHIEIKDYFTGLVDFLCLRDGRDVYLCWRLGEPDVAHWHELEAGFAGRQKLTPEAARR